MRRILGLKKHQSISKYVRNDIGPISALICKIKEKENDVFSSWPHSHPPVLSLREMFLLIQLAPSCIVLHALAYFLADTHQALLLFKETFTS